ncbi:hypothetical protein VTO73DRAFT_6851 [Trametes versicolor]
MTRSHLIFHTRNADSETRIFHRFSAFAILSPPSSRIATDAAPSIVPQFSVIGGSFASFHTSAIHSHTWALPTALQSSTCRFSDIFGLNQCFPTMKASWIVFHMNCLHSLVMCLLFISFHTVCPLTLLSPAVRRYSMIFVKFSSVPFLGALVASFAVLIALYAIFWVIATIFAPVTRSFGSTARSMSFSSSFRAPSAASLSAASFPACPWWPLTHLNAVWALLDLRAAIVTLVTLVMSPLAWSMKPVSSCFDLSFVKAFSTVFESVTCTTLVSARIMPEASNVATASPTWFVCFSSAGTRTAQFLASFSPTNTPAPALASASPFLSHAPSVARVKVSPSSFISMSSFSLHTGSALVKIRNVSPRVPLVVTRLSKTSASLSRSPAFLMSSSSWSSGWVPLGSHLGGRRLSSALARVKHLCGLLQPLSTIAHSQLRHVQRCVGLCCAFSAPAAIFSMSPTVLAL